MISLIVAMDENMVIGKENDLPWHISEDLKLFKRHTSSKTIIMGRNTYDSLKRPTGLPNRRNLVVSRALTESPPKNTGDVIFEDDFNDVMSFAKVLEEESFVIGGARMYKEGLVYADYLYISFVKTPAIDGDTFFPLVDWNQWEEIESEEYNEFIFKKYKRI